METAIASLWGSALWDVTIIFEACIQWVLTCNQKAALKTCELMGVLETSIKGLLSVNNGEAIRGPTSCPKVS